MRTTGGMFILEILGPYFVYRYNLEYNKVQKAISLMVSGTSSITVYVLFASESCNPTYYTDHINPFSYIGNST